MPSPSCRTVDPVELLLRSVLKRALLVAGASSMAACVSSLEHDVTDSTSTVDDGGERDEAPDAASDSDAHWVSGPTDASVEAKDAGTPTAPHDAGRADAGPKDAGPVDAGNDAAPKDAGPIDAGPKDAGALGPALTCETGSYLPVRAGGLKPAQSYDYVAIRRRNGFYDSVSDAGTETWTATDFQVLSETGTKCAIASQAGACADKVAHHPIEFVQTLCVQICVEHSVVTTQANDVKRWAGLSQLAQLLGEIDSPDEALLLAVADGYTLTCGDAEASSVRAVSDGFEVYATTITDQCSPVRTVRSHLHISKAAQITVLGTIVLREDFQVCIGRKPVGLTTEGRDLGRNRLGDHLARCAHLEAASVVSFERLARELSEHGAPQMLVDAALEAREDEVRHAETMGRLARARGGAPVEPEVASLPTRTLEEIALENAVEGCVRETFGALVGGYQAQHAIDGALRDAMVEIAEDEARHAALGYHVHRWIMTKLSPEARERVRHAQQRAVFELATEINTPVDLYVRRLAGMPSPQMARILLDELSRALWRPQGETLGRDIARG